MAATAALVPTTTAHASVPLGNIGGWTQTAHEDFRSALNTSVWGKYSGQPGGNAYGTWSPTHVDVRAQALRLRGFREGSRFVTGGVMLNRPQTYGKWLVRAAFNRGAGIEQVMLLWPTAGWPPELDFAEGAVNGNTMATAHWSQSNAQAHFFAKVDQRNYHVYGLEWTPSSVRFTLDGRVFGTVTGAGVPHQPMSLGLQTSATRWVGGVSSLVPREVTEYVDWISIYKYS